MRFVVDRLTLFARVLFMTRSQSIIGQTVLFCIQRYHRSISDVIYNPAHSFINAFLYNSVDFETHMTANLLTETLMLRDHVFYFPYGFSMSHDELNNIINYSCLS